MLLTASWNSLRPTLLRLRASRRRRINPWRDWAISAVVLGCGVSLGLSALPRQPTRLASAITLQDPQGGGAIAPAVFALRDSGAAVRFANAETGPHGRIRIGFYNALDPLRATATEPMLLPGDARLLWLLADPSERQAIRDRAAALVVAVSSGSRDILTSPEFNAHYRDRLVAIFQRAAVAAWQTTQDNGAWRALVRGLEPALRDLAGREIRPVLERHFRTVPGRMLRANAFALIDPFTDRPWNTAPIEEALRAAVLELRDREVPERVVAQMIESPQAAVFLRLFQDEFVRQLVHDGALQALVAELAFDERFRPYVQDIVARANDLARYAPRLLVSLRGGEELNLVAATVIRATVGGRGDRVVVYMSPAQRDEILALDRSVAQALEPVPGS